MLNRLHKDFKVISLRFKSVVCFTERGGQNYSVGNVGPCTWIPLFLKHTGVKKKMKR